MAKLSIMGPSPAPESPAKVDVKKLIGYTPNPNGLSNFLKEVGQSIVRTVGSVGLEVKNRTLDIFNGGKLSPLAAPEVQIPDNFLPFFGKKTLKDVTTQANEWNAKIKANPIAQKYGFDKAAGPLAFGLMAGDVALNLTGLGGEKSLIKKLVSEVDPIKASALLRTMGFDQKVADKLAPDIVAARDAKAVNDVIQVAKGSHGLSILADAEKVVGDAPAPQVTAKTAPVDSAVVKAFVDSTDPFDTLDLVKKHFPSMPENIAKKTATKLAGETDAVRIETALQGARGLEERLARGEVKVADDIPPALKPLAEEAKKYATADEFVRKGIDENLDGIVPEWGTRNQYLTKNPKLEADGGIGLEGQKWELNQVLKDKPAFLSNTLSAEELRKFASENNLVYKQGAGRGDDARRVVAKTEADADRVLNADTPRELGLALGYEDLGKTFDEKSLRDFYNQSTKTATDIPGREAPPFESAVHDPMPADTAAVTAAAEAAGVTPEVNKAVQETVAPPIAEPLAVSPIDSMKNLAKEPDGKSWRSIIRGYIEHSPKEKKANILSYLKTPEYELERLGLAKGAEMLQDAKDHALDLRGEFLNKVVGWKDEIDKIAGAAGKADANLRIFRWLDGKQRLVQKDMSENELKVAGDIKAWLKELAGRLGLPEDKQISDYITHIFERTSEVGKKESIFDDPDLLEIMDQPAKSVFDPFLEARTGKQGYIEDTWRALDAYAKRASRKIAMDPALDEIAREARKLDGAAYQYVTNMTHNINMRPQHVDTLIDNFLKDTPGIGGRFGERPIAAITKNVRQVFNRGIFGLNVRNALTNISQGANTYSRLGEKYTVVGYTKLLGRMLTRNMKDLYDSHILDDAFIEQDKKLGVYKSILQRLDPKLFALQRAAEVINRGAAYYGAEAKALKKGLSPEQARKYAKRIVRETQFSFSSVDMPVGLNSDLAKTLLQTQSYNVKQIEYLGRMVKNKDIAGLIRYSLASLVFVQTIGSLYGMTTSQILPVLGLSGNPFLMTMKDLADLGIGTVEAKAAAVKDLQTRFTQLFPAGGQVRKAVTGVQAVNAGRDVTPTGRLRFKVDKTDENYLRAVLFGKSGLPGAQEYYDRIGNPKKTKKPATGSKRLTI